MVAPAAAERERAPDLGNACDLGEVHHEAFVGFEVGQDDAQQVVAVAGHQVALHHLGAVRPRARSKSFSAFSTWVESETLMKTSDREADPLGVELGGVALDRAASSNYPPPAWRRTQRPTLFGEVGVAEAAVYAPAAREAPVDCIEGDHCVIRPNSG